MASFFDGTTFLYKILRKSTNLKDLSELFFYEIPSFIGKYKCKKKHTQTYANSIENNFVKLLLLQNYFEEKEKKNFIR